MLLSQERLEFTYRDRGSVGLAGPRRRTEVRKWEQNKPQWTLRRQQGVESCRQGWPCGVCGLPPGWSADVMTHMLPKEPGISKDRWHRANEAVWRHWGRWPSAASTGSGGPWCPSEAAQCLCVADSGAQHWGCLSRWAHRPLSTPLSRKKGCWRSFLQTIWPTRLPVLALASAEIQGLNGQGASLGWSWLQIDTVSMCGFSCLSSEIWTQARFGRFCR